MRNYFFDSALHGTMVISGKFVNQNETFLLPPPRRHMECLRKGDRRNVRARE